MGLYSNNYNNFPATITPYLSPARVGVVLYNELGGVVNAKFGDKDNPLDTPLVHGTAVALKNTTKTTNFSLSNSQCFKFDKVATDSISGFVVASHADIADVNDTVAAVQTGEIGHVALLGSNVEIFLPCDETLDNTIIGTEIKFNVTDGKVSTTGVSLKNATLQSAVIDGVRPKIQTDGSVKFEACKVVRVRL